MSCVKAQPLFEIGLQKQLLVDDYVIAEKQNITRELGKPRKMGVVMKPSVPTDFDPEKQFPDGLPQTGGYYEFGRRLSVVFNDKRRCFQMLYRACGESFTGYAESKDGIKWTKPIISQDGKSNLISYRGKNSGTFYEASFMIDPTVPWGYPEKYKAAYNPGNTMCAIAHSADGIHWTGYNDAESVTGRAADTYNQILWDPLANRYMLLTRTDLGEIYGLKESRATRIMVHDRGNDLSGHPTAWRTLANVNVDHPENRRTKAGVPVFQMESMNIWIYENIYFGLMHVLTAGELTGAGGEIPVTDPDKRPETDVLDYYLGTSRNGKDFDRSWIYARKPFVPRGPDRSFDKAMLQPSAEIITRGDEHLIYYTGQYSQHHSPRSADSKSGQIGLATLRLDGFVCLEASDEWGQVTTKPFKLEGDTLEVNVDAAQGEFHVQVLDANDQPHHGYGGDISRASKGIDELRFKPRWQDSQDLTGLKGQVVKLKFRMRNAKLYAFQIK
ncbi:MAG: glycoside hydrolase family protein [Planctomycetota bacterium]|jgi:hypothetical protein